MRYTERVRLRGLLLHINWYAGVQHAVGQALIAQEAGAPRQPGQQRR